MECCVSMCLLIAGEAVEDRSRPAWTMKLPSCLVDVSFLVLRRSIANHREVLRTYYCDNMIR